MNPVSFWKGKHAGGFEIRLTKRWVVSVTLWNRPIWWGNKGWPWW